MLKIHLKRQQLLRESTGLTYLIASKVLIGYSNYMDIYKTVEEYNPNKKQETFIVFDYLIADMLSNKKT